MGKRLIEDDSIYTVLPEINEESAKEKAGGGRPPFWEMVFWWTRKPLISARSIIAASLLPAGVSADAFLTNMRMKNVKKKPHNYNPQIPPDWREYFDGKSMWDPFAGFGSIPLEGARLGLNVVASELLPTASVFLKAVLEYPSKFGKKLVDDVEKWGNWITEQLKNDPELKELYDDDVAVYIGTWEVKCPHCHRWTPLIGNYWLARVKDGSKYKRVAFMQPVAKGDRVEIKVVDINQMAKDGEIKIPKLEELSKYIKINGNKITVEKNGNVLFSAEVPEANVSSQKKNAQCLLCGNSINFWDEKNKRHYTKMEDLEKDAVLLTTIPYEEITFEIPNEKEIAVPEELREIFDKKGIELSGEAVLSKKKKGKEWLVQDEDNVYFLKLSKRSGLEIYRTSSAEWYVKWALKKYHEGDERFARQRLLVKVKIKDGDLVFEPATAEDNKKLEKAKEKVKALIEAGDPDVPNENIQPYGGATLGDIFKVFIKWKNLFNSRQLLTLIKIVKLTREVGKKVEEEKRKEGWDEEKAHQYAEGVATYHSIANLKYADYNSVTTGWNPAFWGIVKVGHTLASRGIALNWNWCETPTPSLSPLSYDKIIGGYIVHSLQYLVSTVSKSSQKTLTEPVKRTAKALQGDATSINLGEKFDLIVTDPPYANDVAYTELSDFYYVWLKRALSDSDGQKLVPRFHREIFFKPFGKTWREIKTQWQEFAKREVSEYPERFKTSKNKKETAKNHFCTLLTQSFINMESHLKDDGLIVTYYAHTSPEAWAALLDAGWKGAKMRITNAIPIITESAQRITGRGKLTLDTSIVVVWRRGSEGVREIQDIKDDVVLASTTRTMHLLRYITEKHYPLKGRDILVGAMASALSVVTQYAEIKGPLGKIATSKLLEEYVYPYTVKGMLAGLTQTFNLPEVKNPYASYYLVVKAFFGSTSNGKEFRRFHLSADDLRILGISLSLEADDLLRYDLMKKVGKKNSKEYVILEPEKAEPMYMEEFLGAERGMALDEPSLRNPIDALHLLEYYAIALPQAQFKERYDYLHSINSSYVEEALSIAKILVKVLKDYDPEKYMCKELLSKVRGEKEVEKWE